jgi:hypothetical protein
VDRMSGRVLHRKIDRQPTVPAQGPEVFARHAVDLLRASLLDFLVDSLRGVTSKLPTFAMAPPPAEPPTALPRWAVEGGIGVLGSLGGVPPTLLPLVRVRFALNRTFQARLSAAALGSQPTVQAATGTATVAQQLTFLECTAQFWQAGPVRPLLALGSGVYSVGVNGSGIPPAQGQPTTGSAIAFDAGLGLATWITSHLEVNVEAHAILTQPGIAIRFLDIPAAHLGRPSLLGTLTLAGWI